MTSSFAAILDEAKLSDPQTIFTEESWNPVTIDEIHRSAATAYRASKTLAEKAAWDFVADKSNGAQFDLVTVNPPLVFGPVVHYLASLESINTSNERWVDILQGKWKDAIPPSVGVQNWVDVRDVAAAHVRGGLELPQCGGQTHFHRGWCLPDNLEIVDIISRNFPDLADRLPSEEVRSRSALKREPASIFGIQGAPRHRMGKIFSSLFPLYLFWS